MTDITKRLRYIHHKVDTTGTWFDADVARPIMHEAADEIERLRAVIIRAKDALLDGQSTQWVHDLLVAALLGPKP